LKRADRAKRPQAEPNRYEFMAQITAGADPAI